MPKFTASFKIYQERSQPLSYNIDKVVYIMLPQIHRDRYQQFKQALEQMLLTVASVSIERSLLSKSVQEVQQFFGQQILGASVEDLETGVASKVLSYQTEMHKQLRLLGTDAMFLRSAQQSATVEARASQLGDRLKTLIGYCEVLLEE